jgi:hypothetical protein
LELRIKDIIRFIGIEYRIWFEIEKELLSERRKRDRAIYLDILDKIRSNLRKGNLNELEISLNYSKPILIFLQKAIKAFNLKQNDLESVKIPSGRNYTLLKGKNAVTIIHKDIDSFNENVLLEKNIEEFHEKVNFERIFKYELSEFAMFKDKRKKEEIRMQYFNDRVDKMVNNVLDHITSKKLKELYPEIASLEISLEQVCDKCGSTTENTVKKIKEEIKNKFSKQKIKEWIDQLETSFTRLDTQQKLTSKKESLFAIGFSGE